MTFSKSSKHLIVIPKKIVDKCIFYPLFEENSDGYWFKTRFRRYEHREKSIRIKYREEGDYLVATLSPGVKQVAPTIDLLNLPSEYWAKVHITSKDPLTNFISIVNERVKKLSEGEGVKMIDPIR